MSELVKELKDRDELIKQMSELMKELRDQAELTKQISELVGELKDRASSPGDPRRRQEKGNPLAVSSAVTRDTLRGNVPCCEGILTQAGDREDRQNPRVRKVRGGE